ncbi:MAG: hypothetical protein M3R49_03675 [Chloroflexota bacterium]|nr:hypothetical protein [Chloroflexota bacterium]
MPAVLADTRRPIYAREIYAAWVELAASLGLHPGNLADVERAVFVVIGSAIRPLRRIECALVLDELELMVRRRRPMWRIELAPDGAPFLSVDPEGLVDNWAAAGKEQRAAGERYRRCRIQAAVAARPAELSLERAAHRRGLSPRTARRWAQDPAPPELQGCNRASDGRPNPRKRAGYSIA